MSHSRGWLLPQRYSEVMDTEAVVFRPALESDRTFLKYMLELTETWGDSTKELPEYFKDDLERYVSQWTPSEGGVVVEAAEPDSDQRIGAAWFRRFRADAPGYGFIAEQYPEIAVAVIPAHTGKGLGTQLMREALQQSRAVGYPGVSLSVEVGNTRAMRTYEKLGFENQGLDEGGGAYTMLYRF